MPSSRSQLSKDEPMFFFFMCPSFFPFERQVYVMLRRLLGLLNKAVKQHHVLLFYAENNPCNSAIEQTAPDFPQLAGFDHRSEHDRRARRAPSLLVSDGNNLIQ